MIGWIVEPIFYWFAFFSLLTMLIPQFIVSYLMGEQNLKKKYNAEWAVVTGASSGIGRAISEKLASQGINVVLVALPDDLLNNVTGDLSNKYPNLKFIPVGVNLGEYDMMSKIEQATKDLKISLVFNNAGFLISGFFADVPLEKIMANYNCNATCMVKITHFFLNKMLNSKTKGAICFTSSPSGFFPNPSSAIYGSTKAFVTEFASSIAPEVKQDGIDVMVIHPSPVNTQFYSGLTHKLDSITFFKNNAVSPEVIANSIFIGLGRTVVYDQGIFTLSFKLLVRVLDYNLFALIMTHLAAFLPDLKKLRKERK